MPTEPSSVEKKIETLYVSLDDDQHRQMSYWHRRTTFLWNVIVHFQGDHADAYIRSPPSEQEDLMMMEVIDLMYNVITGKDTTTLPTFVLPAEWEAPVIKIKELPNGVVEQRLLDLKRGYIAAKKRFIISSTAKSCAPSKKSVRSNQSVRFTSELFSIEGGILTIHGPNGLKIEHPDFEKISLDKNTVLSVTRRRVRPTIREDWHLESNKRPYSLTFISDNK